MSLNMSKSIVLTYLDIKGIAEPIRITLFSGGIEFEDERIGYEEVARRRSEGILVLPHGQLPTLQAPGPVHVGSRRVTRRLRVGYA